MRRFCLVLVVGCASGGMVGCASGGIGVALTAHTQAGATVQGWRHHYIAGRNQEAGVSFARAVSAQPSDARALFGLASLAHEAGDWQVAWERWADLLARPAHDPLWPAMAASAAHKLEALVGELPGERAQAARLATIDLRPLPVDARRRLLQVEAMYARLAGDEAGARRFDREAGCPDEWLTGPTFGALPRLDLDTRFPPERTDAEALRSFHAVKSRGCRVVLEGSTGRAGVLYALGHFRSPRRQKAVIVIDTEAPYRLFVDAVEFRQIETDRYPPRRRTLTTTLEPGWHRVLLKIGAPYGRTELEVAVYAEAPLESAAAAERLSSAVAGASALQAVATAVPVPPILKDPEGALLADLLTVHAAFRAGDADGGELSLRRALARAPRFALVHLAAAQLWSEDPSRPVRLTRDRARRALERALALDPSLLRARYNLATIALETEHPREALERLDGGPALGAPSWRVAFGRYQAYKARGWKREAELALSEALRLHPSACAALEAEVNERRERHDVEGALRLSARVIHCGNGSELYADTLRSAGDLAGAVREYRRLLALDPQRESWRSALADAMAEAGEEKAAIGELELLVRRSPRIVAYRLRLADALLQGDSKNLDRARQVIEAGLAESPESQELSRALRALCTDSRRPCAELLDPFRLDGKEVIAAFERNEQMRGRPVYDAPAVLLLDRTVTRVFPSGARLTLTHNIIKVLAKDGIDKWGEVKIPEGADVLVLRTVKADGSTREPEELAEKESVSVPDLEVGDYVEFEYVDPAAPAAAFPGGFIAERFYFGSYDAPLDRSEYVVVTPAGMKVEIDRRGAPPKTAVEHNGALEVRSFVARAMPQLFAEPSPAPFVEYVPSVRVGSGITFRAWRDFLRDQQLFSHRSNEELRAVVRTETEGKRSAMEKLAALDGWVRRHIRHGGSLDEAATHIIARGEGNRVTVLAALLSAAGLTPEVWLSRPIHAAHLEGLLPELESFDQPILSVAATIVDPRYRHSATGFLSPALRGGRALKLSAAAAVEFAQLPSHGNDERRMEVAVDLGRDGAADLHVTEHLRGWPALEWREGLEKLAPDRLRPEFEQHTLGFYFPGATLSSLTHRGKDDDAGQFTVEYRFHAPAWARRVGGRLVVPAPYPALLSRRYAGVAERKTPLEVDLVAPTTTLTRVIVPKGAVVALPGPIRRAELGEFEQSVKKTASGFEITSHFSLPAARFAPDRYRAFADFAAEVDAAEARAAGIVLEPASR